MASTDPTPGAVEPDDATPPPIDLIAIRRRYDALSTERTFDTSDRWELLTALQQAGRTALASAKDVPALLAEVERLREQIQAGSDALLSLGLYRDVPDTARATVGGAIRWVLDALLAERDHLACERDALRDVAAWLLRLKDGPRDSSYDEAKPQAWARLRALLDRDGDDQRQTAPSGPPSATESHQDAPRVVPEAPDSPGASQGHRCASCDHHANMHTPEGCWYTVTAADNGRNLVCVCNVAYNNPHPGDATEETTDA